MGPGGRLGRCRRRHERRGEHDRHLGARGGRRGPRRGDSAGPEPTAARDLRRRARRDVDLRRRPCLRRREPRRVRAVRTLARGDRGPPDRGLCRARDGGVARERVAGVPHRGRPARRPRGHLGRRSPLRRRLQGGRQRPARPSSLRAAGGHRAEARPGRAPCERGALSGARRELPRRHLVPRRPGRDQVRERGDGRDARLHGRRAGRPAGDRLRRGRAGPARDPEPRAPAAGSRRALRGRVQAQGRGQPGRDVELQPGSTTRTAATGACSR